MYFLQAFGLFFIFNSFVASQTRFLLHFYSLGPRCLVCARKNCSVVSFSLEEGPYDLI